MSRENNLRAVFILDFFYKYYIFRECCCWPWNTPIHTDYGNLSIKINKRWEKISYLLYRPCWFIQCQMCDIASIAWRFFTFMRIVCMCWRRCCTLTFFGRHRRCDDSTQLCTFCANKRKVIFRNTRKTRGASKHTIYLRKFCLIEILKIDAVTIVLVFCFLAANTKFEYHNNRTGNVILMY